MSETILPNLHSPTNSEAPAVRLFQSNLALVYTFNVYNAHVESKTGKAQLRTQVKLYRDGKLIFAGNEEPFSPVDSSDPKRLLGAGLVQMKSGLVPGEYVIQIVVNDLLANKKENLASQWIDFDVTK